MPHTAALWQRVLLLAVGAAAAPTAIVSAADPHSQRQPATQAPCRSHAADTAPSRRVTFLRGQECREASREASRSACRADSRTASRAGGAAALPLRPPRSRQGNNVSSAQWYVGPAVSNHAFDGYRAFAVRQAARLPMVYAGGSDGVLHAYCAQDGSEKFAYVPMGVLDNRKDLSAPRQRHADRVEGAPFSGDVNLGTSTTPHWRSLLVGAPGAAGTGYFVLDITHPDSIPAVAGDRFAEHAARLLVMDKTAAAGAAATGDGADIGHIIATPGVEDQQPQQSSQIVRLNNHRWAVLLGNGYHSRNQRPVLLIQYLDGARELKTLVAAAATGSQVLGNGLSAPRPVDLNGDGLADLVYAGDLAGQLWKFDLGGADPARWNVAFGNRPLYTARHAGSAQPITAAPVVKPNDRGGLGMMVAFGTGRHLTEDDHHDLSVQSIYAVLDSTVYQIVDGKPMVAADPPAAEPVGSGVADLVQQSVSSTALASSAGRSFYTVSQNPVRYAGRAARKGWYLHLPVAGERLLQRLSFYDASNLLEVRTEVPAAPHCRHAESGPPPPCAPKAYRTFLNIMDGRKPSLQIIDTNRDGVFDSRDAGGVSRMSAAVQESQTRLRDQELRSGADGVVDRLRTLPEQLLRPSWRQLR